MNPPQSLKDNTPPNASAEIRVTECSRVKKASAYMRHGIVHVKVPKRWRAADKRDVAIELVERVLKKEAAERKLMDAVTDQVADTNLITLTTLQELEAYVDKLNAETFQVRVKKVRIGQARYTRLAQVNLRTGVMTVSRYCLTAVPESALRYLIIHELAHYLEASHNKRFWGLVGRHVPDYRYQSKLMKAFHRRSVLLDMPKEPANNLPDTENKPKPVRIKPKIEPKTPELNFIQGLLFNLQAFLNR